MLNGIFYQHRRKQSCVARLLTMAARTANLVASQTAGLPCHHCFRRMAQRKVRYLPRRIDDAADNSSGGAII
jgi:hypothetical protein